MNAERATVRTTVADAIVRFLIAQKVEDDRSGEIIPLVPGVFAIFGHGNALSLYVLDPEGNQIELYCHTPWYVRQPSGKPMDLTQSEAAILAQVEREVRADPSFMPREQWMAQMQARMR